MITRRKVLTGAAAIASTVGASTATLAQERHAKPESIETIDVNAATVGTRMNLPRAFDVMERFGLDAMVLGEGLNVYHATGYWPLTSRMGHAPGAFAIVTRNSTHPVSLVMSSFTYYYQFADIHRPEDIPVYLYTMPADFADTAPQPEPAPLMIFPDRKEAPLDSIESRRANLSLLAKKEQGVWAGAKYAMVKALDDAGLSKAKMIGVDHSNVDALLRESAPTVALTDADDSLRHIRPYKSASEIDLMRKSATANAQAALAAVRTVRDGATYNDLRSIFWAEAARRGNRGVFMVIDRVSSDYLDAPFRDGQAFLIDAVSEYQGYHGDYGRTVFIGEPSKAMDQATKAMGTAWDEVRDALKPGMRFSEIMALGAKTLKKLGGNYSVSFAPHSVGLYHTDHVGKAGARAFREDWVLEKGMVLSVDCPMLDAGMGGSAHLEDLTLITENGCESINDEGDQTIIV